MTCPGCNREVIEGKSTCPFCGLIFEKWRGSSARTTAERAAPIRATAERAAPAFTPEPDPEVLTERIRTPAFIFGIVAALIAVLIIALGVRSFISGVGGAVQQKGLNKPAAGAAGTAAARRALLDPRSDFDLSIDTGGDPLGIVWGKNEFLIGNRISPWGFLRTAIVSQIEFSPVQNVQVIEPVYNQQVALSAVAWNGKNYIGYADGAYFDKTNKNVFTIHDPSTLAVTASYAAPELLGGLAWDGSGYWAGSRRNTEDSTEPAFLYRLDQKLHVLGRYDPPAVGCQGLAWDGSHLWWADVFTGNIYILKVDGSKPETLHTYHTRLEYLSGIAFDGSNIWITEYGDKKLRRLNPKLTELWSTGDRRVTNYEQAVTTLETLAQSTASTTSGSKDDLLQQIKSDPGHSRAAIQELEKIGARDEGIQVLQELMRSPDGRTQSEARDALRQLGVLPTYDRYVNSFSRTADDADAIEISAELAGDKLRASWRIYFGSQIFAGAKPDGSQVATAKYRVTVRGGNLTSPVMKEYDAKAGDNVRTEELAGGLGPGRYTVEIAISAQFTDSSGANKVLNRVVPPLEVGR
jgi:hypothetical protein